ncbi:hypothetical protein QWY14_08190 [Planococcus sp. N028]|uniref:Transposase n=1 Tax=Planococcus shixiaomingii TaxID=3058393 RepID=A0ABT8N1J9_9BACL|nr:MULTISPECIES: hypothetical protein [unclassified Planococcus (in: firmicutes)]MDN7241771.1 hypothetical protein [Planococcus sp. N028]WKA54056.1 hypothetical protein QWY21_15490 [Planococcus sp. N022]
MPKDVQLQLEVHMEQLIRLTGLLHKRLAEAERELSELKAIFRSDQKG